MKVLVNEGLDVFIYKTKFRHNVRNIYNLSKIKQKERLELIFELDELKQKLEDDKNAKIVIKDTVYPGTKIVISDVSKYIKKFSKNLSLFLTAADLERESIINGSYNYDSDIVPALGFPRYDGLMKKEDTKQILLMPTWDQDLKDKDENYILKSPYYIKWNNLFNNKKLINLAKEKGYEILYFNEYVDEFAAQVLMEYDKHAFANVASENIELDSEEEKEELKKNNEESKNMFEYMQGIIKDDVKQIRFTKRLKTHPVCLTSEGNVSVEMEKVINAMPTDESIKAEKILEINENHPIAQKIKDLYENNKEELEKYTKVLYAEARLIEGLPIENPTEISNLVCEFLSK